MYYTYNHCPGCRVSLLGAEIPENQRDEHYGGDTHFKREISVYDWDSDMTISFYCPDCGYTWCRFTGKQICKS